MDMDLSNPISAIVPSLEGQVLRVLAHSTEPLSGSRVAELATTGSNPGVRTALNRLVRHGTVHGERANDQDHRSAVELLFTVEPGGSPLAGRLLAAGARPRPALKATPARVGTRSRPHVVGGAGASQLTESCCLPSEVT